MTSIAKNTEFVKRNVTRKQTGRFLATIYVIQTILINFTMNEESEIAQALNSFGNSLAAGDQDALREVFTDFFCEQSSAQTRTDGKQHYS